MALVLVGCKSGGEDKVISDTLTQVKNGIYQKCSNDDGESYKETIYVSDSYVQERYTFYTTTGCPSGSEYLDEKVVYSYEDLGSFNYKLRVESAVALPLNVTFVTMMNSHQICGSSTWAKDIPKSTIGLDCGSDSGPTQIGDEGTIKMGMVGASLRVVSEGGTFTYSSLNALNFANTSQSLQNGNYGYYDGTNGMYLNINGTAFTATVYDQLSKKYFVINGTTSGSGNTRTFTVGSTTPSSCPVNDVVYSFSQLSESLALREDGESDLVLQKLPYSASLFVSAYLENGYSSACF